MVVLTLAYAAAPPAVADYELGQRAWEAGRVDEATSQWRAAADAGDRRAMLALGRLYVRGLGVLQDFVEAHKWLNLAASRGEAAAVGERDALAAKMTSAQIAEAQEQAGAWRSGSGRVSDAAAKSEGTPTASTTSTPAASQESPPPPPRAIREAQTLLRALGYRPGPADGRWGRRVAEAYRAFLGDAGLPAADMLTPGALRAMRAIAKRSGGARETGRGTTAGAGAGQAPSEPNTSRSGPIRPDALHRAARAGDIDGLKAMAASGVDVDGRDGRGWTALMHAVNQGYTLLVPLLLEAGADVDIRAPDGATALFMAAAHGHSEIIEQLMKAGAELAAKGPKGKTAVEIARARYGDRDAVRASGEGLGILALVQGITWTEARDTQNAVAALEPKCADLPGRYLGKDHAQCWAEFENRPGCYAWTRHYHSDRTARWSGRCDGGFPAGRGTFSSSAGSEHSPYEGTGTFVGGKRNGRWTENGTGIRYDGEYRDGKRHGRGTMIWANGDRYAGEYRDGKAQGRGTMTWTDGTRYQGEYRDGRLHGRGTMTWANGARHEGVYRAGKRHGRGTMTWANGARYAGEYRDGKPNGRGTYTNANGTRYEGRWRNGCYNRNGRKTWVYTTKKACGFQ